MLVYGLNLQFPNLRAIDLGTGPEPSWFAPEHLRILPDQIYARVIPEAVAQTFHSMSCKIPQSTRACIELEGLAAIPRNIAAPGNAGVQTSPLVSKVHSLLTS